MKITHNGVDTIVQKNNEIGGLGLGSNFKVDFMTRAGTSFADAITCFVGKGSYKVVFLCCYRLM